MTRRINVGCGEFRMFGFENIDITEVPAVTGGREPVIVADALGYDYSGAVEIYAGHVIEHLTLEDARRFLSRVHEQVPPGALLTVTVPAIDRKALMSAAILEGTLHGGRRWTGDEHRSLWTCEDVFREMAAAGWTGLREWPDCPRLVDRAPWQVCVRGVKETEAAQKAD